jgi:hypothetical protein
MTKLANALVPVKDVAIRKRQVTVEVLTIDTRQVTQSLYKQMVEGSIVDPETGELQGEVWGWVNLHLDCNKTDEHLHVVWERDGKLRRSCMSLKCCSVMYEILRSNLEVMGQLILCHDALGGGRPGWEKQFNGNYRFVSSKTMWFGLSEVTVKMPEVLKDFNRPEKDSRLYFNILDEMINLQSGIKGNFESYAEDPREDYLDHGRMLASQMRSEQKAWEKIYREIEEVGQLFIAVSGVWK